MLSISYNYWWKTKGKNFSDPKYFRKKIIIFFFVLLNFEPPYCYIPYIVIKGYKEET